MDNMRGSIKMMPILMILIPIGKGREEIQRNHWLSKEIKGYHTTSEDKLNYYRDFYFCTRQPYFLIVLVFNDSLKMLFF